MKKTISILIFSVLTLLFYSCENDPTIGEETNGADLESVDLQGSKPQYFLVANRGDSSVSIFNAKNTDFITKISLPDADAQPTYLAHSKRNKSFYVGDFANSKVVYYDARTFEYQGEIAIDEGAFHMWINNKANQLWINNIVSKTTSVIDLYSNTVIGTLPLPTDQIPELTENAVQHDVTISPSGYAAYVTVLDGPDTSYVVMYKTSTLEYIKHEVVGGDAHLLAVGKNLYVPSQNAGEIKIFNRFNLEEISSVPFSSAHGVTKSKKYVFTTGIADNKLGVINRKTKQLISEIDTDFNKPHNLAVSRNGKILFLAHSGGTETKVAFYKVKRNGNLVKLSDYDSGLNPFGVLRY